MSALNFSVLFVDDDTDLLSVIKEFAEDYIHDIVMATSVDQALEILKSRKVDVIVSDFQMDGLDGVDLRRQTKEVYPDIKFAMYSGYVESPKLKEELAIEKFPVLEKPVDPIVLIRLILELGKSKV